MRAASNLSFDGYLFNEIRPPANVNNKTQVPPTTPQIVVASQIPQIFIDIRFSEYEASRKTCSPFVTSYPSPTQSTP